MRLAYYHVRAVQVGGERIPLSFSAKHGRLTYRLQSITPPESPTRVRIELHTRTRPWRPSVFVDAPECKRHRYDDDSLCMWWELHPLSRRWVVLRGVLADVQSKGARLFVIDLAQGTGRSAVARLFTEYARDNSFAELAHGDFKLLGKVVRNLADPDEPGIDLLRGTGMGGMGEEMLEELLTGFREAASEGLNLPEITTTVDAPALHVVPIGVYV